MRAPEWWWRDDWRARALVPLSWLWRLGTALRWRLVRPVRAPVPVICVGNVTAGGAGKTPTVIALVERLRRRGINAHALTRGHGGRLAGPLRVDPLRHDHRAVGDEALLLAAAGPAWVARDRAAGAVAAAAAGAAVIVLDDGFQNPGLAKDLSLLVVDGPAGFGNGRVMPAGPLREPLADALARADAAVLIGPGRLATALPVLTARLAPAGDAFVLPGRRLLAFAGIGRPSKFTDTLAALGAEVVAFHAFPDHHAYTEEEVMALVEAAGRAEALPITTRKDWVRLPEAARPMVAVLDVALVFDDPAALDRLIERCVAATPPRR